MLDHRDAMNRARVRHGKRLGTLLHVNRNRTTANVQFDDGAYVRVPLGELRAA